MKINLNNSTTLIDEMVSGGIFEVSKNGTTKHKNMLNSKNN